MFIRITIAIALTLGQQAMSNKQQAVTGLGFVFEDFCKAIPTVSFANALWEILEV
ncbi:hypothetical protein [Nostoc sp.]|uniref:hypothetical protein n=1 Tax=Nostoc sp. TaxID=1180 RepID=UPI002FFBC7B2